MNRQMRRHHVHPLLPISPVSKKREVNAKRQKNYVAKNNQQHKIKRIT